jgi:selenocysteine lyase/cysteine desulfurase
MPNYPAVYANRAALAYVLTTGVADIAAHADPLVRACLNGLKREPVELLTPDRPDALAGIVALRHSASDEIYRRLHERNIHVMHHAGRLRVALHGYNTAEDVDAFLATLREALAYV